MKAGHELERNKNVISWVKNDHAGFVIKYMYNGTVHDCLPDFLIKLRNGVPLFLEIKGMDDHRNKTKRKYLKEWIKVVNEDGNYGTWACDVAFRPMDVRQIIGKHAKSTASAKEYTKCPGCGMSSYSRLDIGEKFGFRNVAGIIRPQSWYRECRKAHSVAATAI